VYLAVAETSCVVQEKQIRAKQSIGFRVYLAVAELSCVVQEKQIRAKQSIKEISSRWQTQRNQVADKVKKSMGHRTALIPKVPPPPPLPSTCAHGRHGLHRLTAGSMEEEGRNVLVQWVGLCFRPMTDGQASMEGPAVRPLWAEDKSAVNQRRARGGVWDLVG